VLAHLEHGLFLSRVGVAEGHALGKWKTWAVNPNPYLTLDWSSVPSIDVTGVYKYLGVPEGI